MFKKNDKIKKILTYDIRTKNYVSYTLLPDEETEFIINNNFDESLLKDGKTKEDLANELLKLSRARVINFENLLNIYDFDQLEAVLLAHNHMSKFLKCHKCTKIVMYTQEEIDNISRLIVKNGLRPRDLCGRFKSEINSVKANTKFMNLLDLRISLEDKNNKIKYR